MRISADISNTTQFDIVPDGVYVTSPSNIEVKQSRYNPDTGTGGNPMIVVRWRAEGGQYDGRIVGIENIMLGGTTKEGQPMPLFTLMGVVEALKLPWACDICYPDKDNSPLEARDFRKARSEGHLAWFCPDKGHPMGGITVDDPETWKGRRCNTRIGHEKVLNSDRTRNVVMGHSPIN